MTKTHYETLGISEDADEKTIKQAYRRRVAEVHPDKHPDSGDEAHQRFLEVKAAHEELSDAEKRASYDRELAATRKREADVQRREAEARKREAEAREAEARRQRARAQFETRRAQAPSGRRPAHGAREVVGPIDPKVSRPARSEEPSGPPWGKIVLGAVGAAAAVGVVTYAAKRWAPVDHSVARHRDRKTGRFRKGYVR